EGRAASLRAPRRASGAAAAGAAASTRVLAGTLEPRGATCTGTAERRASCLAAGDVPPSTQAGRKVTPTGHRRRRSHHRPVEETVIDARQRLSTRSYRHGR